MQAGDRLFRGGRRQRVQRSHSSFNDGIPILSLEVLTIGISGTPSRTYDSTSQSVEAVVQRI